MKYSKIRSTTFQEITLNAGMLLSDFDPSDGAVDLTDILGTTSGGITASAVPSFKDYGEDLDNCPKNTKELKKIESIECKMSGTFKSVTKETIKKLAGAADIDGNKITLRTDLDSDDFETVWWVGDYSDKNGETNGGYIAIKLSNALSTGGFQIQSADKDKGSYTFEFTGHYTMADQTTAPMEIYLKAGTAEPTL